MITTTGFLLCAAGTAACLYGARRAKKAHRAEAELARITKAYLDLRSQASGWQGAPARITEECDWGGSRFLLVRGGGEYPQVLKAIPYTDGDDRDYKRLYAEELRDKFNEEQ